MRERERESKPAIRSFDSSLIHSASPWGRTVGEQRFGPVPAVDRNISQECFIKKKNTKVNLFKFASVTE